MAASRRRARATNRRRHRSLLWRIPGRAWFWAHAKRISTRILPSLLILVVLGVVGSASYLGFHWVTHSERFAITEFEVEGNSALEDAEIVELLSLDADANIFATDMATLEARLVANPWIATASISRSLPKGLEIAVEEHSAAAAVELEGLYLINADGHPFKRADLAKGELDGLCVITGLTRERYLETESETRSKKLQYALSALSSYHANAKRPKLGELHLDAERGITLITYEKAIAIHLGTPKGDDFEDRFRTFDSAWAALDQEEHAAARAFRIADRTPSDQVTIAFAGN